MSKLKKRYIILLALPISLVISAIIGIKMYNEIQEDTQIESESELMLE